MADALRGIPGRSPSEALVPTTRAQLWRETATAIRAAGRAGGQQLRVHSPQATWAALHHSTMPRGATWGQLFGDLTASAVAERLTEQRPAAALRIASWNCRWLPELHTPAGRSKADAVARAARGGAIVLLRETHLSEGAMAAWAAGLDGCRVTASAAIDGERGGPSGGVAICYPDHLQLISTRVLTPGRALEAVLRNTSQGTPHTICAHSVYLPPRAREDAWRAYLASGAPSAADFHYHWLGTLRRARRAATYSRKASPLAVKSALKLTTAPTCSPQ